MAEHKHINEKKAPFVKEFDEAKVIALFHSHRQKIGKHEFAVREIAEELLMEVKRENLLLMEPQEFERISKLLIKKKINEGFRAIAVYTSRYRSVGLNEQSIDTIQDIPSIKAILNSINISDSKNVTRVINQLIVSLSLV